jgi:RNA polymerase sigma-70 factor (ECF subfamily)
MDYELIVPYIPNLRRYARALVGDRDGADDLVQDTLERAVRKFHLWRPGDLRAWLFSIMHNVFVNQLKSRKISSDQEVDDSFAAPVPGVTRADELRGREPRPGHSHGHGDVAALPRARAPAARDERRSGATT